MHILYKHYDNDISIIKSGKQLVKHVNNNKCSSSEVYFRKVVAYS